MTNVSEKFHFSRVKYRMRGLVRAHPKCSRKWQYLNEKVLADLTFEILRKIPKLVNLGSFFWNLLKGLGHIEQKPSLFQSLECFEWSHHWSLACYKLQVFVLANQIEINDSKITKK